MKDEKFLTILIFATCFAFSACQKSEAENNTLSLQSNISTVSATPAKKSELKIREIDFKNSVYPWTKTFGNGEKTFTLENGEKKLPDGRKLLLNSISYDSLNGGYDKDEAIITVAIEDGNATSHMLFVYTMDNNKLELLESFEFAEDANLGAVFVAHGELVIENYKAIEHDGECCPSIVEVSYYQWKDTKFVMQGSPQIYKNGYVERLKAKKQ